MALQMIFLCNQGRYRSRTAYELYKDKFNCTYAGIHAPDFDPSILEGDIICMEESIAQELERKYPEIAFNNRIFVLNIPDVFDFMDKRLIKLIKAQMKDFQ